jgi:hypothetical protein
MPALRIRAMIFASALAAAGLAAPAFAQAPPHVAARAGTSTESALAAVRAATERFQDAKVALAEGYIPDPSGMCITAEMEGQPTQLGAMGIHYFRPDLLGITGPPNPRVSGTGAHTDFLAPAVLIYEPQKDGSLRLVAVENLVFQRAWKEAGNTSAPSFLGNEYYPMIDNPLTEIDEAHGFEPHYELHVWLYRENPNGMFAPFNPRSTCQYHEPHAAHAAK